METLTTVMEAMRDSAAVVVLYTGAQGATEAGCLWSTSITLTQENKIVARCYCTLRREWRSFCLDRMTGCHALTTPDDAEGAA